MKQNLFNKLWLRAWMLVAVMCTAFTETRAEDKTITLDYSSFGLTTSYAEKTATVDGFEFIVNQGYKGSGNVIQMNSSKGSGILYNTTAIPGLKSITVNVSSGNKTYTITTGTTEKPTANSQTGTSTGTYNATSGDEFFQLKVSGASYFSSIVITYEEGGSSSTAVATTTIIDASGITNTDVYKGTVAGTLSATVVDNDEDEVEGATVTWSGDNDDVATIDEEGNVTLVAAGTVIFTATYAGVEDEYESSSDTYEMTVTDTTPVPSHTVTFSINGVTSTQDFEEGAAITFPDDPADVSGKTFVGWVAEAIEGTTNEAPEFVTSATMGENDVTFYAVFAYAEGGGSAEVVDVLTRALIGITGTSYSNWSGKTASSDAVYAGQSAGGNTAIQLRSTSPAGIVTTTSGGKAKKVTLSWNASTASGRTIGVYGSTKVYESGADLYNITTTNKRIGTIVKGTSTELDIDGDYEYIGLRSESGALYLDEIEITWSTGGGVTYSGYCTTVVAAAVARPTIEVAENPFLFSTTAAITCDTEGAIIKYSFDGETWNDYTEALTITATTTLYAKAVKNENESEVASVTITKNLAVPTVAIDATGITNTNVFDGTEAGSLAASVTYNDAAVEGATVTWSGNNDEVATIDENGAVTLVAAGTVTFTATYAGNEDYAEKTATYEMTVTNSDPNAPGSENNPYTVAEIIEFIETLNGGTSDEVFVKGIISQIDSYNSKYNSITYWISDDGTTSTQFECYSGLGLNGAAFSSIDDLQIGDEVVVAGTAKKYGDVYEFNYNNYIVSLSRVEKPAAPTFSVAEGTYTEALSVELSTTTEGATIYYTVDGTEPTAESTVYAEAIVVTETTTIKAIAVKNDVASEVATATYTINISTTPSISIAEATIEAPATETFGDVAITYENLTISGEGDFDVQFYDGEGEETEAPDWVLVEVAKDNGDYVVSYMIDANDGEARTAYFKVYAMDGEELVYSNLVTVSQAAYVAPATVDQYALFTGNLVEGDYIIYYNGLAMNTDVQSDRLQYAEVTPENDVIATDNAAIVWHIAKSGDYWTIYNAEADAYAASTGAKNKAQMLADGTDDKALWSVSGTDEYEFVNKKNSDAGVNAYLRNNGTYGFACYAVGTGGDLTLYKKVGDTPVPTSQTVTVSAAGYATLVAAHDLEIPSGVEVYAVEIRGEWAHLEPVTAGIPAGEAVVVKAEAGEYVFNYAAETVNALTVTNDLVAATAPVTVDGTQYVLAKPANQEIGFYKATGTIAAGKAYLQIAGEAPVKGFTFKFDDDATAIDEIVNGKLSNGKCYNLAGQRVSKMQRGINIVNGKKILK